MSASEGGIREYAGIAELQRLGSSIGEDVPQVAWRGRRSHRVSISLGRRHQAFPRQAGLRPHRPDGQDVLQHPGHLRRVQTRLSFAAGDTTLTGTPRSAAHQSPPGGRQFPPPG
jgi:hypothetical protein